MRDAIDPVTDNEVILASQYFGNAKAPGLDRIPNRALKMAIKHCVLPSRMCTRSALTMEFFREYGKFKDWYYYLNQENHRGIQVHIDRFV